MLPHGEVLVRNIHHGKNYCKEKFGVNVPVAWAADGFGLNSQMPQIYKKSGYRWVAFRRGAPKRVSEFYWRGLDGTSILAHWMALGYRAGLFLDEFDNNLSKLEKLAQTSNVLMPSGSGSTIPVEDISEFVNNWNETHDKMEIKIAAPTEFFKAVEKEIKTLSVLSGEIHSREFSEIFPDVGSSRIWIRKDVKKYEVLLLNAEKSATLAWLLGKEYPSNEFKEAWEKMFFIASHDIITGCGIDEIYSDVKEIFEYFEKTLNEILLSSLSHISKQINTEGPTLVVFNLLSWQVTNLVEGIVPFNEGEFINPTLLDGENEIQSELSEVERYPDDSIKKTRFSFNATVPPLGYKALKIVERKKAFEEKVTFGDTEIANEYYKIKINPDTGVIEVKGKDGNLIFEGNEIVIDDEVGDLYFHRSRLREPIIIERNEGNFFARFKPKSLKVEGDSLKAKIIFETEYYGITWPYRMRQKVGTPLYKQKLMEIKKEITIYHGIPRIDFITNIKNKFPNVRIRVNFKTPIKNSHFLRETQYGIIKQPVHQVLYSESLRLKPPPRTPCIHWMDYHDKDRGLMLINKGTSEIDVYENNIYMTLIRSVNFLSTDGKSGPWIPTPDALELKDHTFHYSIHCHEADCKESKAYQKAHEYSNPLISIYTNSKGKLPREFSFIELNSDSVMISAIKKAELDNGVILRFYEIIGKKQSVSVKFFNEYRNVFQVDLLEQEEKKLDLKSKSYKLILKPYEIVTLKFKS
jgi:alpha-mannosidase